MTGDVIHFTIYGKLIVKYKTTLSMVQNKVDFNNKKIKLFRLRFERPILGRRKRDRSISQAFSDKNNLNRVIFVQFDSMAVLPKNHKS